MFAAALWIVWLVSASLDAAGQAPQDATQTSPPLGVGISIKAVPDIATVGDPIRINLDITMPAGYHVEIPKPESQLGDFTVLDFFPGPTIPDRGKSAPPSPPQAGVSQHYRAQILTAIYKTGKFKFPSIRIKLGTANGREIALSSSPVDIEIRSVLGDKDQNLKDLKKQVEMPERGRWIVWLIAGAGILALGIILWILRKRRSKRGLPISPAQMQNRMDLAEADLRELLARGFPDNGHEKQFYILLSEIVKRILEAGYVIHTAEQTTSEIMDSLCKNPNLESGEIELIESFLLRCDIVKFAKYAPSRIENEAVSNDALQILAEARNAMEGRQSSSGISGAG